MKLFVYVFVFEIGLGNKMIDLYWTSFPWIKFWIFVDRFLIDRVLIDYTNSQQWDLSAQQWNNLMLE